MSDWIYIVVAYGVCWATVIAYALFVAVKNKRARELQDGRAS